MQSTNLLRKGAISLVLTGASFGQGPVGDEVMVTFDRPVQVGSQTLPAGKYTIRQVTSASNPRVLKFTSDNGRKLDATVTAIPVLQNTPPSKTTLVFEEAGQGRLSKIWIHGKSYGYEFPGRAATLSTGAVALEGRFVGQPAPTQVAAAPERAPEPAPVAAPKPAENLVAQNRPAEPPAQAPAPAPAAAPEPQANRTPPAPGAAPPAANQTAANREPETLPSTASGWMETLLLGSGSTTAALYMTWRRRRARS